MKTALLSRPRLQRAEFDGLRRLIHDVAGIHLRDSKVNLVEGRLQSRLRTLNLSSFKDYLEVVAHDAGGDEVRELVNCITTNKTSFFREPHHFDFLASTVVPAIVQRGRRRIRIWSAGCSTGQEPWTIAMTLASAIGSLAGWDIRILASDLDTNVLETAERAIYDDLDGVPLGLRQRYFEPAGRDHRVIAELRSLVTFRRVNLVAPTTWSIRTHFDAIFCRNVAIYFDHETQATVFNALASHLEPTGYLMSGHSENLHWLNDVLRPIGQTVHRLASAATPRAKAAIALEARRAAGAAQTAPVCQAPLSPNAPLSPHPRTPRTMAASPRTPNEREVAIQVGGIHASASGARVRTTLGSCVAACLYDPVARVGGMNHFLLPEDRSGTRCPTNFGVHAMEILVTSLMKLGGDRRRFVAKLFGASELFQTDGAEHVARQNAEFALHYLEEEGIPVIARKLGGPTALSVVFDTAEGRASVTTLGSAPDVVRAERRYRERLSKQERPIEDDITFFGTP